MASENNGKRYTQIYSVRYEYFEEIKIEKKEKEEEPEYKYVLKLPCNYKVVRANKKGEYVEIPDLEVDEYKDIPELYGNNILTTDERKILASGQVLYKNNLKSQKRNRTYVAYLMWCEDNDGNKRIIPKWYDGYKGSLSDSLEIRKLEEVTKNRNLVRFKIKNNRNYEEILVKDAVRKEDDICKGFTTAFINVYFLNQENRKRLYKNGFDFEVDGKTEHYVRYKRSASSAREGKCLFIAEDLQSKMEKWSFCGLNQPKYVDTKWEAYVSLTLSGIMEHTITLKANEILIMKDAESKVMPAENCVAVQYDDNTKKYETKRNVFTVKNTIWDGEALLDESVFLGNPVYSNEHMMLLRSNFFKSCAFRTKLQKWFIDNEVDMNAKAMDVLNGETLVDDAKVSDIKLIITESSLKYLKFYESKKDPLKNGFRQWFKYARVNNKGKVNSDDEIEFGVVKTDLAVKKSVRASYQLLNTLGLTQKEFHEFMDKYDTEFRNCLESPKAFFDFLNYQKDTAELEDFTEDEENIIIGDQTLDEENITTEDQTLDEYELSFSLKGAYETRAIRNMYKIYGEGCQNFKLYKDYRNRRLRAYKNKIKSGHMPIEGTYLTLFGNPAEFLYATIHEEYCPDNESKLEFKKNGKNHVIEVIKGNCVYTKYYDQGKDIFAIRYPHITMGNIFCTQNMQFEGEEETFYDTYFDLGMSIVCINSIGNVILDRLNGADFDSDMILVSDNGIIINAAKNQMDKFPVPINKVSEIANDENESKKELDYLIDLSDKDNKIMDNKLGLIVNLATYMNGEYWTFNKPGEIINLEKNGEYNEIAKLEVLSNIEVDRAKKDFPPVAIGKLKKDLTFEYRNKTTDISDNSIVFLYYVVKRYCANNNIEFSDLCQDERFCELLSICKETEESMLSRVELGNIYEDNKENKELINRIFEYNHGDSEHVKLDVLLMMPTYYNELLHKSDFQTLYKVNKGDMKINIMLYLVEKIYKDSKNKSISKENNIDNIINLVISDKIIDYFILKGLLEKLRLINAKGSNEDENKRDNDGEETNSVASNIQSDFLKDIVLKVREYIAENGMSQETFSNEKIINKIIVSFESIAKNQSIMEKCVYTLTIHHFKYTENYDGYVTFAEREPMEFELSRSYAKYFMLFNKSYNEVKKRGKYVYDTYFSNNDVLKHDDRYKELSHMDYSLIINNKTLSVWKAPVSLDDYEGSFMGQLFTWINGEVEKDNKYFEKLFIDENTIINEEYERYKQYELELYNLPDEELEYDPKKRVYRISGDLNGADLINGKKHMKFDGKISENRTFVEYADCKDALDDHIGDRLEQVRKVLDCYNSYSVLEQREENDKVITKAFNNIYKNIRKILEQKNITNIEYKKAFKTLLGQYESYCDSKCSDEEVDKIEQILFMMVLYSYSPFVEE